jgi:diguanylate cyclase (GGDEF)-like protein/PAS domain S-box-containing protein
MFEAHPLPMWIHDRENFSFLDINRAALQQLGYRRSEFRDKILDDIFHAEEGPLLRADLKLVRSPKHFTAEWHLRCKDGRTIGVDLSSVPLKYKNRKAILLTAYIKGDQSLEHRVLEARLRINEFSHSHSLDELLQKTLDEVEALTGSNIGFFHFLEADQKTLWLQNWSTNTLKNMCTAEGKLSHYGIDKAGVWVDCVRQLRPVIHNDYAALPDTQRKGLPPGHATVLRIISVPIFRQDKIVAILGVGNKATDYDDKDVGVASLLADLAWDIAGYKRAETELRASEERYRIVSENPYDWEFWQDAKGNFLYNSPSCQRVTGHAADEFARDPGLLLDVVHPEDREAFLQHRYQFHKEKRTGGIEFRVVRPDGSICWVGHVCQPIYNEQGIHLGIRGSNRDITARKQAENDLMAAKESLRLVNVGLQQALAREQRVSRTDPLTEVFNRRHFFELAEQAFGVAQRYQSPLALIMFDIDFFKQFNDQYGHHAGDEILKNVAQITRGQLRNADVFARYGGEEFVALLPNASPLQAFVVAERIREAIAAFKMEIDGVSVNITFSGGIAGYSSADRSLDEFVDRADKALYAAKQAGRNCVKLYPESR